MRVFTRRCVIPFRNCNATSEGGERSWTKRGKIIDANRSISYVSIPGVTKLNLTKITHNVQKWLPINVLSRNCDVLIHLEMPECRIKDYRQISAKLQHNFNYLPHFNSKTTRPIFTKLLYHVETLV